MSVAYSYCGTWWRPISAGSPGLACPPRRDEGVDVFARSQLTQDSQCAALSSSDPAALPSSSVERVFCCPFCQGFFSFFCPVLKRENTLHRSLAPSQISLLWIWPLGQSILARPLYKMLPSFHIPPLTKLRARDRSLSKPAQGGRQGLALQMLSYFTRLALLSHLFVCILFST